MVPVRATSAEGPQAIEFEPPLVSDTLAANPYAPKRSADAPHYSWQSTTQPECASAALAKTAEPAALKFDGSVGVFPPLTAGEIVILAAQDEPNAAGERRSLVQAEPLAPAPSEPAAGEHRAPDLVVASLRPAFRHCFSRWLDEKADAEGSVRLALELGCAGNVQAISADVKGVDEPTVGCLFTVVGPAQFEPPANGHATIQVPVVFKNASR